MIEPACAVTNDITQSLSTLYNLSSNTRSLTLVGILVSKSESGGTYQVSTERYWLMISNTFKYMSIPKLDETLFVVMSTFHS